MTSAYEKLHSTLDVKRSAVLPCCMVARAPSVKCR